jgi:hypothetical protein
MKRTHRFPARLIRWTSSCVCFVLLLSCFVVTPLANLDHNRTVLAKGQSSSQNGNIKKVDPAPPVTGPPAANLPNLDEVKLRRQAPRAPEPVSSTLRARRKPIESRQGRKVGDPLPTVRVGSSKATNDRERIDRASTATRSVLGRSSLRSHHARRSRTSDFLVTPMPQNSAANSLSLNGSGGYESIPSSTSLNISGALTLEAWVKPSASMYAAQIVSRYGGIRRWIPAWYIQRQTAHGHPPHRQCLQLDCRQHHAVLECMASRSRGF